MSRKLIYHTIHKNEITIFVIIIISSLLLLRRVQHKWSILRGHFPCTALVSLDDFWKNSWLYLDAVWGRRSTDVQCGQGCWSPHGKRQFRGWIWGGPLRSVGNLWPCCVRMCKTIKLPFGVVTGLAEAWCVRWESRSLVWKGKFWGIRYPIATMGFHYVVGIKMYSLHVKIVEKIFSWTIYEFPFIYCPFVILRAF